MKTARLLLILAIAVAFPSPAAAKKWKMLSTPELVQASDLIAVGIAARDKGEVIVRVSEILKGDKPERIVLNRTHVKVDEVIPVGKEGGLFLVREGTGYQPFHPSCYKSMAGLKEVKAVLGMFADPGPYLNLDRVPENPDIVYVLGEVFSGWRVVSKDIPPLGEFMRFAEKYYEAGPWVHGLTVTLECETGADGTLRVTSARPGGPLAEFFERRMLIASRWPYVKAVLKPRFRVTLDTSIPESVGSASSTGAVRYLRGRLRSTNPDVVDAALLALAKMRDGDAVPLVVPLLGHKDRRIQVRAVEFLGWSRSKAAAEPLMELLDAEAAGYPKNHDLSNAAAISLGRIGTAESVLCLERAACHGVERAIEAVGAIGRTESFEILLKAAKHDPQRCAYMDYAFYWLVRRSNKNTEEWMIDSTWTTAIGAAKIPRWVTWWESNRADFKVTKSQQEAIDEKSKSGT